MIIRLTIRIATLTTGAAILIAGAAASAQADEQFGQHVEQCARTIGFDQEHNPGMHQGAHGWNPDHTC